MTSLFDSARSAIERDAAMSRVAAHAGDFMVLAGAVLTDLPPGEWTGEQIRARVLAQGISPHHHNGWGALIMAAVKRGVLVHTGRSTAMAAVKSHARRTPIYSKG